MPLDSDEICYRIFRLIEVNPDISQRELAKAMGISLGKANYLLNALIEKGLVKAGNFRRNEEKLSKVAYLLTPAGIRERIQLTRRYLARKEYEYEALRAEIHALKQEVTFNEHR
ncbi:MAG: MarR family EPS-associated transcriptional regulator [Rhodocyclaceae bacterium]|jgi:EPS-associated MarR family transcriptional regulator|nr:MarR family EPS-associated transcriptional regulator [Rhodocyclaceae bacterium]